MRCQFIVHDDTVIKGTPIAVKFIHPDIIVQIKNFGWDGSTIHIYYDTLYFIDTRGKVCVVVEKIYRE